jgi:hypothetical protein
LQQLRRMSRMREGAAAARGLSAATLREIASAVAMLGSRKPQERAAGAGASTRIARDEVCIHSNRKLVEFQEAVVAAGGIPLIARAGRVCGGMRPT